MMNVCSLAEKYTSFIEKWRRQDGSRTDDDGSFCA